MDTASQQQRESLKKSSEAYKDSMQYANNHYSSDPNIQQVLFRSKKSFFNHKFATQELLRSQHLYKLMHEVKYTPDKNVKSYPDVLESGYKEVLKVDDKDHEIRAALVKWYAHRLDMILFHRKNLQKEFFRLFSCDLDTYAEKTTAIKAKLALVDDALAEVEDILRNLKSEKFFKSPKVYEKHHLPELSVACAGNVVFEQTYAKTLKNFTYITIDHVTMYFNDFVNLHYATRHVKKVRLINDYLVYKIQLENTSEAAAVNDAPSEEEEDKPTRIFEIHRAKPSYTLASTKAEIQQNVASLSSELNITEDINIDFGCLLLFAIDKRFDHQV